MFQVVFATPGMLHAGQSLQIFKKWAGNEKNMVRGYSEGAVVLKNPLTPSFFLSPWSMYVLNCQYLHRESSVYSECFYQFRHAYSSHHRGCQIFQEQRSLCLPGFSLCSWSCYFPLHYIHMREEKEPGG